MISKICVAVALSAAVFPGFAASGGDVVPGRPALAPAAAPAAAPVAAFSLAALRDMARATHPSLAAADAYVEAGQAQLTTAAAYPNPDVEFLAGRSQARLPGAVDGSVRSLGTFKDTSPAFVCSPRS